MTDDADASGGADGDDAAGTPVDTDRPTTVDAADLPDRIAAGDPLLVMFRVEGCSICAAMEPVLDGVARQVDVPIAVVNPRDHPPLVDEHRITSTPTLVLFGGGQEVDRLAEGFVPAEEVVAFVESGLATADAEGAA